MAALTPEPQQTPSRRGAPLGNNNARKHGVYVRTRPLGRIDPKDLAELGTLTKEIYQLRAYYQVVFKITPAGLDYSGAIYTIRALSQAAVAISRLYETNFELIRMRAESRMPEGAPLPTEPSQPVRRQPVGIPPLTPAQAEQVVAAAKELENKLNHITKAGKLTPAARDQFIRQVTALSNTAKDYLPPENSSNPDALDDDLPDLDPSQAQ